ncbi:MAG: hypothetical protein V3V33_11780 [Candidatus Lokiarchaeia archaeon]
MVTIIENYERYDLCTDCNGNVISNHEKGEKVCTQCGLIINERELDLFHNEKRAYTQEQIEKKYRTGIPISELIPDLGLCTLVYTKTIYNSDFKRAVKRDKCLSWDKRHLLIATTELRRLGHILNLPSYVQKSALDLYKKAFRANLLRGRSILCMVVACIYYVCKEKGIPRTLQEITQKATKNYNLVKKCYKSLINALNLKTPTFNPVLFIPRYIVELGLNYDVENLTIKILQSFLKKSSIRGIDPKGLCAGAIYLVSKIRGLKITQKEIGKKIGVADVTLRARYKELKNKIKLFRFKENIRV